MRCIVWVGGGVALVFSISRNRPRLWAPKSGFKDTTSGARRLCYAVHPSCRRIPSKLGFLRHDFPAEDYMEHHGVQRPLNCMGTWFDTNSQVVRLRVCPFCNPLCM